MASVGSTSAVSNVTVNQNDTSVEITNQVLTLANTEYSKALPTNCKKFFIKARTSQADLRIAYTSNGTNLAWFTLKAGSCYTDDNYYTNKTIYVQSNVGATTVEIVAFY